nr:restriction endonuclease [Enterococcus sp. 665A]
MLGSFSLAYYFVGDGNPNVLFLYIGIIFLLITFITEVFPYLSQIKRFSKAELETIDLMTGLEFEKYMAFLLEKNGYLKVKVTQSYGDQGIDIIAQKNDLNFGFQCKRWKKNVGNKAIQEVHAGIGYYSLDRAIVITNSYFTKPAKQLAEKLDVELWDRKNLIKFLEDYKKLKG